MNLTSEADTADNLCNQAIGCSTTLGIGEDDWMIMFMLIVLLIQSMSSYLLWFISWFIF